MKKIIFAGALAFLLVAGVAQAHTSSFNSVTGSDIRWGGSTTYSSQWNSAVSTWNGQDPIDILPDKWWTFVDVVLSDVDDSSVSWAGLYTHNSTLDDTIKLNIDVLENNTSAEVQHTATHELGHALGLAHSTADNVMYYQQSSQTALGTHDISDYDYLWN